MRHHAKRLKVLLIGCGRIAQSHVEVLRSRPEVELVGVVDINAVAAKAVAERAGVPAFADYREAVAQAQPEGVVICTPPATHARIATELLEQGVHVLCEKPLATRLVDAEAMVAAAERGDAVLMMASKFRYVRDVVTAKEIIEAGLLGDIVLYENTFCSRTDMRGKWYAQREVSGGGVLIDNGSHAVDIARYLLGPIAQVQVQEGKNVQRLPVEDSVQFFFRTATEVMGTVHLSWSIPKEQDTYVNVYGTEGLLSIGWQSSRYRQSEKVNWVTFGSGYQKMDAMGRQMRNFIDVINGVDRPVISETDALESVRVIETAYQSLGMDKWLAVRQEKLHAIAA
jgi:predicted dehydrogenase